MFVVKSHPPRLKGIDNYYCEPAYAAINVKPLGGGRAKAGDLNSDHLFSSNAQPQGN